jgi:hypothetical protein
VAKWEVRSEEEAGIVRWLLRLNWLDAWNPYGVWEWGLGRGIKIASSQPPSSVWSPSRSALTSCISIFSVFENGQIHICGSRCTPRRYWGCSV